MKRKLNKPILGSIGLILVAIMTVIAYFIPTENANATSSTIMTDNLKVVVYDQYPAVTILSPASGTASASSELIANVFYENVDYIDFKLSYTDEDGNTVEIPLSRYTPSDLDPEYSIASGEGEVRINLSALNVDYNDYVLSAYAHSPIGYDEDMVDFTYVPAAVSPSYDTDENGDPIIVIEYGDGTEKIEVMVYDKDGNAVFDEPITIDIPAPYEAGSKKITLPLGSYGLESGDYYVGITTYKREAATDDNGNPLYDENGNPIMVLAAVEAPNARFKVKYIAPEAPAIPNTGQMLQSFNIAQSDYLITISLVMAIAAVGAIILINKTLHKKNYRKNYISRHRK